MEFLIIAVMAVVAIVVLAYIFDYSIKKLKHIGEDEQLDNLAKVYPSNMEMCKEYLKKLKNEKVNGSN